MLQTQKVVFPKIQSLIDLKDSKTIEVETHFSLTVDFDENKESCSAAFDVSTVCKEHPDRFSISVQALGFFKCDKPETDADKKNMHAEAYDILFPYMQSMIADLTTKAGTPPLMLKMVDIDFSAIKIADDK